MRSYWIELVLVAALMAAVGFFGYLGYGLIEAQQTEIGYSGENALSDVATQVQFGPRIVGTEESTAAQEWLARELYRAKWHPTYQPFFLPAPVDSMPENTVFTTTASSELPMVIAKNIIASSTESIDAETPVAWLIAPYDTRLWADADPDPAKQQQPTPGANGGASGPAALLELARTVDKGLVGHRLCIVLLDGEANRGATGWTALTGIDYFLRGVSGVAECTNPEFAVILDLVGGANQQIYIDHNSDPAISAAIWEVAEGLGHGDAIINEPKWAVRDIVTILNASGIPAVAMLDYDYPYRATTNDTIDKLSADSFTRIGDTLVVWLESGAPYVGK